MPWYGDADVCVTSPCPPETPVIALDKNLDTHPAGEISSVTAVPSCPMRNAAIWFKSEEGWNGPDPQI
jgi:hypothetical protein